MEIENIKKGEQLILNEPMGKSVLSKVGSNEKGYAVTMGKYRITDWFKTKEELDEYIRDEPEDFIIRIVANMIEVNETIKKNLQE